MFKTIPINTKHVARTAYNFQRQIWLLLFEVPVVFFFMRALEKRRLDDAHPWVTGTTEDGDEIWPRNIVYRSPSRLDETTEESDAAIVTSIGRFLRSMVRRSAQTAEIPQGPGRRMPHGVNYIHGAVHYNGAFLLFDDFADLVSHLTDRRFRRDVLRFGRRERREVTFVFRTRRYDPLDFAYLVGCVRAHLPWFSNGNGPTKRPVLWGNMSPYAAVNLINGAWIADLFRLWRGSPVARRPVDSQHHFAPDYFGRRAHFSFTDRLLAWYMFNDVRSRGFRGQLFFTDRAQIEPYRIGEYREAGGYWKWAACHEVPRPRLRGERSRDPTDDTTVSVIIPTLNEGAEIHDCLEAVRAHLRPEQIIVVDAGSADNTVSIARRHGVEVLVNQTGGRGGQCRTGAEAAIGNVLVFLHADSRVGPDARLALDETFADGERVAMFRQRSRTMGRRYQVLDSVTRIDSIFTRFGDQGIIVQREFYDAVGGMPNMPLFEDVHLLRKARRRGRIPQIRAELGVSARRFESNGVARQLAKDAWLLGRYYAGGATKRLYDAYYNEDAA